MAPTLRLRTTRLGRGLILAVLGGALLLGPAATALPDQARPTRLPEMTRPVGDAEGTRRYIVVVEGEPLATADQAAPADGQQWSTSSAAARSWRATLLARQDAVLADVAAEPVYRYTVAVNGFAVALTEAEVAALSARDDVRSVTPTTLMQAGPASMPVRTLPLPDGEPAARAVGAGAPGSPGVPATDLSPSVLGLSGSGGAWSQLGGRNNAGRGVVVGVLDTGLEHRHSAFTPPAGFPAPPDTWSGACQRGEEPADWPLSACDTKVVGARYFVSGFRGWTPVAAFDSVSPFDTQGHGTHVAGTVLGKHEIATLTDGEQVPVSGMAPAAHLAVYKVCWVGDSLSGCDTSDSVAAIDQAIADRVDVLTMSIAGSATDYDDPVELAYRSAASRGIFVSAAAGNDAPTVPVNHLSPWAVTVGAMTHRPDTYAPPQFSITSFSGRGPAWADHLTILKPDVGAPGSEVLAPMSYDATSGKSQWFTTDGTSMATPHVAGFATLARQAHPTWKPLTIKSALMTTSRRYANAVSNRPMVGGAGWLNGTTFLQPGLAMTSVRADWDAFLANPSAGYHLNLPSLQIPRLDAARPTVTTRRLINVSDRKVTYTARVSAPSTLSVEVSPRTITVQPGRTAEVTIWVANTGASSTAWQNGSITWRSGSGDGPDVRFPITVRGPVAAQPVAVERWWSGAAATSNRYSTAQRISQHFPHGATTVYIASGTSFADALAGSPAAAGGRVPGLSGTRWPAPVLLVKQDSVPSATRQALADLRPQRVVVLGGTSAVSNEVYRQVGGTHRVAGASRWATAVEISRMYAPGVPVVYLANGESEGGAADALVGAARAGKEGGPVLLTRADQLPGVVAAELARLRPAKIVVLGSRLAVSDEVYRQAGADARIAGPDRWTTATKVSAVYPRDVPRVLVANGYAWPDTLAGASLAGALGIPVQIVKATAVPGVVATELDRLHPQKVAILGGPLSVTRAVETTLNTAYQRWAR